MSSDNTSNARSATSCRSAPEGAGEACDGFIVQWRKSRFRARGHRPWDFLTAGVGGRVTAPARSLHEHVAMDCLSATTTCLAVVLLSTACTGCASDRVAEAQPEARPDGPSMDAGSDGGSARPPGLEPSDDAATAGVGSDSSDAGA